MATKNFSLTGKILARVLYQYRALDRGNQIHSMSTIKVSAATEIFLDEINKSQQLLSSGTKMKTEYLRKLSTAVGLMVADHPS